MKYAIFALFIACTVLTACSSDDKAKTSKTRANSAEYLPAEDK